METFSFAIVGAGLTGTSMLVHLMGALKEKIQERGMDPSRISIAVIERQEVFGPGFPHGEAYTLPCHLINMCARDMGIISGQPGDFEQWVAHRGQNLNALLAEWRAPSDLSDGSPLPCNHYPRLVMGAYLKERFQDALFSARHLGIEVAPLCPWEITDIQETSRAVQLIGRNLISGETRTWVAGRVLLATGHWFEERSHGGFFPSPWPAHKLLSSIPPGAEAAILGTSLSALDTVLTLTSDGHFERKPSGVLTYIPPPAPRRMTLYSRGGLLPAVRGRIGPYRNRFLTPAWVQERLEQGKPLTLHALFRLLDQDLAAAYGHPFDWKAFLEPSGTVYEHLQRQMKQARDGDGPHGDILWQTVLQQIFPVVRQIYLGLGEADRRRFERDILTRFFVYAAPMPFINAEKLLELMKWDIVRVVKLGPSYELQKDPLKGQYTLTYQDEDGARRYDTFSFLVDARGQDRSFENNPQALARNLLASGTVEIQTTGSPSLSGQGTARTGSIWIDPGTFRVCRTGPQGQAETSQRIYAVGAMTRGQIIDASMAYASAVSTARVAEQWVEGLSLEPDPLALCCPQEARGNICS